MQSSELSRAIEDVGRLAAALGRAVDGVGRQPRLRSLGLVLTTRCNLQCSYCYQSRERRRTLQWETARRSLNLLYSEGEAEPRVTLFGGEPLLEWDLLERIVRSAETAGSARARPRFRVTTNGTLLDAKEIDFLAEHRVHTVVSCDGVPAAQDHRADGSSKIVAAALKMAANRSAAYARDRLEVRITLTARNVAYLAESVLFLLDQGVRSVSIAPVFTPEPEWRPELEAELNAQFSRLYRLCLEARRSGRPNPVMCLQPARSGAAERQPPRWMCGAVNGGRAVVDVTGIAYGCSAFVGSFRSGSRGVHAEASAAMRIGEVMAPGFLDRLDVFRDQIRSCRMFDGKSLKASSIRRCTDCPALSECTVCPASIGTCTDGHDPDRLSDLQCSFNFVAHRWRRELDRSLS